jgi:hypothetical protein
MAKNKRAQTISDELLATWKSLKRHGDPAKIAKALKKSRPTIDNALIYGAVHNDKLAAQINKFFRDRQESETAGAPASGE